MTGERSGVDPFQPGTTVGLSEDESAFLLWFDGRIRSLHAAGNARDRVTLEEYRTKLLFGEKRSFELSADLKDKGLLRATHNSFHWDGLTGGGGSEWWELELTDAGKAEVKRLRRWWRTLLRTLRAQQRRRRASRS